MQGIRKMEKKKVVLAYSGGLDTSVILKWLSEKGMDVICYIANVGQIEDFDAIEKKAYATGASKVYIVDLREEFVEDYIFPAICGNAIYESRYLLGTALARPVIAKKQIEIAIAEGAEYVSHGATGKGNDQVRFEFTFYAYKPDIKIIAPWRDKEFLEKFKGRTDLINYSEKMGIPIKATKSKPFSEDENIMHISHEAGILEDPRTIASEDVYSLTKSPQEAPDKVTEIEITFEDGNPVEVRNFADGNIVKGSLDLYNYLNELGKENGIGRLDMVENRYIGIKSRGVYETPGATILVEAHRDVEGIAMDKEVMHIRNMLSPKFAELIYNGYWFSPEMDFILAAMKKSQEAINGKVILSLYKGNVNAIARESSTSLYNQDFASMDIEGGFDAEDSTGFININAIRLKAHNLVLKNKKPYAWRTQ